ncbi:MAG: molybdenum cofactor biosynthesis protein MoaE [Hyphomicrobium sp.]
MSVRVQEADFDVSAEISMLTDGNDSIGAVATFIGKVRGANHGNPLRAMVLEHYPGMTEAELGRIEMEAVQRFKLSSSLVVHRVGELHPGDNIVLVITCSPHRGDALAACEFLMDYLKTRAPFWKKEIGPTGEGTWVDARDSDDATALRWSKSRS